MPLAVGVVIAAMLLAAMGVGIDHVLHAYPAQFWFGVASFLILVFALAAARFRKANERVPLRPAALTPPPLPPAVKAAPVRLAVASPEDGDADDCEGPGCSSKVDDDPWTASVEGDETDHLFCSERCAQKWKGLRSAPSL